MKSIPLGPWRGIKNVGDPSHQDYQPPAPGQPLAYLREAMDVDLTSDGWPRARQGFESVAELADGKAIFEGAGLLLIQDGGSIVRLVPGDPATKTVLVEGLDPDLRLQFHEWDNQVWWVNGETRGRITAAGAAFNWGMESPAAPVLTAADGADEAALVQVAWTLVDAQGIKSGASASASVESDGSIECAAGATPFDPSAVAVRIYASTADGTLPYFVRRVDLEDLPATLTRDDLRTTFDALETALMTAPPTAASGVASFNDRLLVWNGPWLYLSSGISPHLFAPLTGEGEAIKLDHDILAVQGLASGIWVATTGGMVWLQPVDGPALFVKIPKDSDTTYAAGSALLDGAEFPILETGEPVAAFLSKDCVVYGLPGGVLRKPITKYRVAGCAGLPVSFAFREIDGIKQLAFIVGE